MEKFTVDLDKVLDEFEFNNDQPEQVVSISDVPGHARLPLQCGISNVFHQSSEPSTNSELVITNIIDDKDIKSEEINIVKEQESISTSMDNIRKSEIMSDNLDSINHFYTHDNLHNDKLLHKQYMNAEEAESSSLIVHNDISQKLLQKQLNDNVGLNQNSCSKRLNQPNIKPSVSNVFSNLNEYINNSSVNLVNLDTACDSKEIHERQNEEILDISDSFLKNFVKNNTDPIEKFSIDELLTTQEDIIEEKENNAVPQKYQNILLPIILDPCTPEKSIETNTNKVDQDTSFPDLLAENSHITNVFENPERIIKNILDEPEHVYENVYIGTDIPKTQQFYPPINTMRKIYPEFEHTYENVNYETPTNVMPMQHNKDGVYECIYIGNRDNLPETNTELEIAAKQMVDQFILKESELQSASTNISASASMSANASTSASTELFQKVQLEYSQIHTQEPKHVVGFTTIDDMSEEELSKYLAELEAEERANERASLIYENIGVNNSTENLKPKSLPVQQDEDANEAPIFEAVIIGELPQVPQEDLQEKAKKFPVIDYSKQNTNEETSRKFSSSVKIPESSKSNALLKDDETKINKNLKIHESVSTISDNTELTSQNSSHRDEMKINKKKDTEKDKENGNYVLTSKADDKQNKINVQNLKTEEIKNSNYIESTVVQKGNIDNKNLENIEENINVSLNDKELTSSKTPVRNTETISRFSVTRNVDVNDKLDGRSKSSQSHSRTKNRENNTEHTEIIDDLNRPPRPQTLDVISTVNMTDTSSAGASYSQDALDVEGDKDNGRAPSPDVSENSSMESGTILGKQPPFWVPDSDAPNCMLCDTKFTVMKRRHHCRACGKVLCNKCCNMRYRLEYQSNVDSRVCIPCHQLLIKAESDTGSGDYTGFSNTNNAGINSPQGRQPNPNNPMEYCSTIPPLQQLAGGLPPPPTVMVPVGVLKREGSTKQHPEGPKSVMFSDGIRPGCDLTELDTTWDWKPPSVQKMGSRRMMGGYMASSTNKKSNCPQLDAVTNSFAPQDPAALPPTVTIHKGHVTYHEVTDTASLYTSLKNECEPPVMFAINRNLYAYVKIVNLNCCVNRICWNVTSKGLACFGQDEVVFLVETFPDEIEVPKDLLLHINQLYHEALRGNQITEYGMSIHHNGNLLGSREHAGFLFIRQTLQCLQKIVAPPTPFLIGLLVHRWETPWAKIFPLRLVLRLGAEYRYYPCPLVSVRFRDAVYFELGHTIIRVLADFRNFAYSLPKVQGLTIHMQDNTTHVRFPKNRYNQVIKGLNNSNDHVLAFASNFSIQADSHFVCMQSNSDVESTYQTQAINIQNKPRKVTGASFIVINGALKSSMGLSAKSRIVEDGITVQIMPEKMEALKAALKNMQDFTIGCGRQGAPEPDEIVNIKWVENDTYFNIGVKSPIDGKPMDGIPSIRVHSITNCGGTSRFIRWTELFIIKSDDDQAFGMHYKLSESIARATCVALVKLLDLLANAGLTKIAVRTTIHPDNVGYEAGSEGTRLPPIYMNSLDNELIKVLQKAVQGCEDTQTVLELIFYVLEDEI